jgi:hypothetical protein
MPYMPGRGVALQTHGTILALWEEFISAIKPLVCLDETWNNVSHSAFSKTRFSHEIAILCREVWNQNVHESTTESRDPYGVPWFKGRFCATKFGRVEARKHSSRRPLSANLAGVMAKKSQSLSTCADHCQFGVSGVRVRPDRPLGAPNGIVSERGTCHWDTSRSESRRGGMLAATAACTRRPRSARQQRELVSCV